MKKSRKSFPKSCITMICFILILSNNLSAQSVSINTNGAAPNPASILDIDVSANNPKKGLLIPRMSLLEKTAMTLASPAQGLLVYQTDGVEGFYYNTSLTTTPNWIFINNSGSGLSWDQILSPSSNLTLAHGANTTNFTFDGATADPFNISSNSISSGNLIHFTSSSTTGIASGISRVVNITRYGANLNANHTAIGLVSGIGNTGTGSTNYAGLFYATGAVNNYGIYSYTDADLGVGIFGQNTSLGFGNQVGIYGSKTGSNGGAIGGYGVQGSAFGSGVTNVGGYFTASGATNNYGARGTSDANNGVGLYGLNNSNTGGTGVGVIGEKSGSTITGKGYGVWGLASGTGYYNYGGFFTASGATFTNQAVHGETGSNNGTGVWGENNSTGAGTQTGVSGVKTGSTPSGTGYGISGSATGSANLNAGGNFDASGALFNYGVSSTATGAGNNYGGYFSASGGTNNFAAIFSQGNVGIGTSLPLTTLHVKGTVNVFYNGSSTHTGLFWLGTSSVDGMEIVSTPGGDAYIGLQRSAGAGLNLSRGAGAGNLAAFNVNGTTVGTIYTDGATTSYFTTSDMRLKENITPANTELDMLLKIKVKNYNYISDSKKELRVGFLAQDLYAIFPEAVHKGGNNAKTDPWTIDYSKLTPVIVKSVQELNEELKSEVASLRMENEKMVKRMERLEMLVKRVSNSLVADK